ncbi:MAG: hypothetical protein ACYCXQ_08530 [Candidatus Humimicrobiaceae bacterium]
MEEQIEEYTERHAEMISIFPEFKHSCPKEHLFKLKKLKSILKIPVIASLNAVSKDTWIDYAKKIEGTGVDGIGLNFYSVPLCFQKASTDLGLPSKYINPSAFKILSNP